jgi:hypothetical protein
MKPLAHASLTPVALVSLTFLFAFGAAVICATELHALGLWRPRHVAWRELSAWGFGVLLSAVVIAGPLRRERYLHQMRQREAIRIWADWFAREILAQQAQEPPTADEAEKVDSKLSRAISHEIGRRRALDPYPLTKYLSGRILAGTCLLSAFAVACLILAAARHQVVGSALKIAITLLIMIGIVIAASRLGSQPTKRGIMPSRTALQAVRDGITDFASLLLAIASALGAAGFNGRLHPRLARSRYPTCRFRNRSHAAGAVA